MPYNLQEAGKRYGYVPRMRRNERVHQLLWYLAYGFDLPPETTEDRTDAETLDDIFCPEKHSDLDDCSPGQKRETVDTSISDTSASSIMEDDVVPKTVE